MNAPLLSLLIALPLGTALGLWVFPARWARKLTVLAMLGVLGLSTLVFLLYDPDGAQFQFVERRLWIDTLKVQYLLAIDGLSVLFLASTALLFLGAWLVNGQRSQTTTRMDYSLLLCFEAATLGIFCALDTVLFFVFWEASLIPIYLLLSRWGLNQEADKVATRYVLLMLAGGIPILLAIVALASAHPDVGFDVIALLTTEIAPSTQKTIFFLFLLGFALKVPLVPLHSWLPQFALTAPGSLTALLVGLKLGVYGLVRLGLPLAPDVAPDLHWLLAGLGTVTLLYGAVGMLAQSNLRVGLAYASISHVGLAVLGLASFSAQGVQGCVALLLSFTVATGGGFLLLECLRQRTGSCDLADLGGAARSMPLLASGVMICGLAGVGMPGTSSFPGEYLLILATLEHHTGAGMAALFGLSIAAGGFLTLYRQAFFGPVTRSTVENAADLDLRERGLLALIILMAVGIGLYPAPWFDLLRPAAEAWAGRF